MASIFFDLHWYRFVLSSTLLHLIFSIQAFFDVPLYGSALLAVELRFQKHVLSFDVDLP